MLIYTIDAWVYVHVWCFTHTRVQVMGHLVSHGTMYFELLVSLIAYTHTQAMLMHVPHVYRLDCG